MPKYVRGQVWYWDDPLYGSKNEGGTICSNEGSMRFSRYVLIAQDTDSIGDTVIGIPLSTQTKKYETDVGFELFGGRKSYARTDKIASYSVRAFKEYICTISDDLMQLIEQSLFKLLKLKDPNASKRTKWDERKKQEFVNDYENGSVDLVCRKYGITKRTAQAYHSKFAKMK